MGSSPSVRTQHRIASHWLAGAAVLLAGLGLTALLVQHQGETNKNTAQMRFDQEVRASTDAIGQRVAAYSELVAGMRDLFLADPDLGYQQFERVVSGRHLHQRFPEIRNISFARWVTSDQLPVFEARLRQQAHAQDLAVHGDIVHPRLPGPDHYIVEYLWPQVRNDGVWGLDIASQPANLASLLTARSIRQPVVSAPFELRQEQDLRQAFMVRFPVFASEVGPTATPPQFMGAIAAIVRVSEMLAEIKAAGFLNGVALRLQDIGLRNAPQPAPAQWMGTMGEPPAAQAPSLHTEHFLNVHGRRWQLAYTSTAPLLSAAERLLPTWMATTGALLSLLLAFAVGRLVRQRGRALDEAEQTHHALYDREQRLRTVFHQAAVGVSLVDIATGRFLNVNQKFADIMGYTREELLALDVPTISSGADLAADNEQLARLKSQEIPSYQMQKRLLRKDGAEIWVDMTISAVRQPGKPPAQTVGVIQDITERHRMADALKQSEARQRAMLDHLPTGIVLSNRSGQIEYRNCAFVRITGYGPDMVHDAASWALHAYPDLQARERATEQWRELYRQARTGDGRVAEREYPIRCADGKERTVAISGVIVDGMEMILLDDLTERKETENEITFLASYDPLTGLANRSLLIARLGEAMQRCHRSHHCGAVLMLDLDHFKALNETRGYEQGDALLRLVAQRLQGFVRGLDTLARHGDDDFVLVMECHHANADEAATEAGDMGQQILQALRQPFLLLGEPWHTSASIGIALFRGDEESVDELLQQVDMALYQAKAAGRNTLRFYDAKAQAHMQQRTQLELDMRAALEEGQFELYYQPQVQGARVLGAEALVRWHHPRDGFVSPGRFIALAEESGLILPLGQWVLEAACRQLALWASDPVLAELKLAVNVSPRQFYQSDFADQVLAALAVSGANAHRLELELTEGLLLQDVEGTIAKMSRLKAYGIDFALDDFGTGYSSLAYLKRLPLDKLKIDQSFVRDVLLDPNDAAIARTVVALGTSLGLRTVAEGVETEAQKGFLLRHGCSTWQGYLFSKPVPIGPFEDYVCKLNARSP